MNIKKGSVLGCGIIADETDTHFYLFPREIQNCNFPLTPQEGLIKIIDEDCNTLTLEMILEILPKMDPEFEDYKHYFNFDNCWRNNSSYNNFLATSRDRLGRNYILGAGKDGDNLVIGKIKGYDEKNNIFLIDENISKSFSISTNFTFSVIKSDRNGVPTFDVSEYDYENGKYQFFINDRWEELVDVPKEIPTFERTFEPLECLIWINKCKDIYHPIPVDLSKFVVTHLSYFHNICGSDDRKKRRHFLRLNELKKGDLYKMELDNMYDSLKEVFAKSKELYSRLPGEEKVYFNGILIPKEIHNEYYLDGRFSRKEK